MNATELNKVLETEIHKLRGGKTEREDAIAVQRLASSMIAAARLELQFARLTGATPHSPYYSNRSNGRTALPNDRKR